jgi:CHAT domain-containing protein
MMRSSARSKSRDASSVTSRPPELSGLVLSLVDSRGQPQDGFLRLHDIYNLKLDAALRDAQLALRRDRRWSDPYYWGAFVLQGEWR